MASLAASSLGSDRVQHHHHTEGRREGRRVGGMGRGREEGGREGREGRREEGGREGGGRFNMLQCKLHYLI